MILDIPKGVKDVDKVDKEEQKTNLKEEAVAVSTSQLVSHIKQSGRPVTLTVAIQDPGLTNQKLNAIIVKKKKTGHYARDYWSPTKRIEENANLVIEEEKEATLLLVHNEIMQDKKNM
jgi:uncharacterized membrane protein